MFFESRNNKYDTAPRRRSQSHDSGTLHGTLVGFGTFEEIRVWPAWMFGRVLHRTRAPTRIAFSFSCPLFEINDEVEPATTMAAHSTDSTAVLAIRCCPVSPSEYVTKLKERTTRSGV